MSGSLRLEWSRIRERLAAAGFHPSRRLGQNFLLDENMVRRIATDAEVGEGDRVIEVGTGCGFLTAHLDDLGARVLTVEVDRRLHEVARELLAGRDRIEFLLADVLAGKHALSAEVEARLPADGDWHLVANLPYSVASPVLALFAERAEPPASMTVLVQAEVAERVAAPPGTRDYGPLTVRLGLVYRAAVLRRVPPQLFAPRPKVDSAVLRLERREVWPDRDALARASEVVGELFRHRRKALGGQLGRALGDREAALGLLERLGLAPEARPESVAPEAVLALAESPEWASRPR